jgi:hypothetical protein
MASLRSGHRWRFVCIGHWQVFSKQASEEKSDEPA